MLPAPPPPRTHSSTRSTPSINDARNKRVGSSVAAGEYVSPESRPKKRVPSTRSKLVGLHAGRGVVTPTELVTTAGWGNPPRYVTAKELRVARKQGMLPDTSYDIDGDGTVSARDVWFARKFDLNNDGKLSPAEQEQALGMMVGHFKEKMDRLRFSSLPAPKTARDLSLAMSRFTMLDACSSGDMQASMLDPPDNGVGMTRGKLTARRRAEKVLAEEGIREAHETREGRAAAAIEAVAEHYRAKDSAARASHVPNFKSRKELRAVRKLLSQPDPSYDIAGDGGVSPREFYFAARFDRDGDGVITESEKAKAWLEVVKDQSSHMSAEGAGRVTQFDAMRMLNDTNNTKLKASAGSAATEASPARSSEMERHARQQFTRLEASRREKLFKSSEGTKLCLTSHTTAETPRTRTVMLAERRGRNLAATRAKLDAVPDFRIALGAL